MKSKIHVGTMKILTKAQRKERKFQKKIYKLRHSLDSELISKAVRNEETINYDFQDGGSIPITACYEPSLKNISGPDMIFEDGQTKYINPENPAVNYHRAVFELGSTNRDYMAIAVIFEEFCKEAGKYLEFEKN